MSTNVVGVGMTDFVKPRSRPWDYPQMVTEAVDAALGDATLGYDDLEFAAAGYVYGDSTSGQRALYDVAMTGIPIVNVNNNCATGSSALFLAHQLVDSGAYECALAVGFERMDPGPIGSHFPGRADPLERHYELMKQRHGHTDAPPAPQLFGNAGREHAERFGTTDEQFATVAVKNHRHSVNNPRAQFRQELTLQQVLDARQIHAPLTLWQCSPPSEGAAAAIVASDAFVDKHGLREQAVKIEGMVLRTDTADTFEPRSCMNLVGYELCRQAATSLYEATGHGPEDVDVIELHDCFTTNEILAYESLQLCRPGGGGKLVMGGAVTYGGEWVVNPSGGLLSKGHPLGATGIAQCAELVWQLRGQAGARQVPGASRGLQHNIGLGGAAVLAMYSHEAD